MTIKSTATAIRHKDPLHSLISGGDIAIRSFEMTFSITGDTPIIDAIASGDVQVYLLVGSDTELLKFYQKDDTATVQGKQLIASRDQNEPSKLNVTSQVIAIRSIPEQTPFEFGLVYSGGITAQQSLSGSLAIESLEVIGFTQQGTDLGPVALLVEDTANTLNFDIEIDYTNANFVHQHRGHKTNSQANVVTIPDGETLAFGNVVAQAHQSSGQRNEMTGIAYLGDISAQIDPSWDDLAIRLIVDGDTSIKDKLADGTLVMFVNARAESGFLAIPAEYNFNVQSRLDGRLDLFMSNIPVSTVTDLGQLIISIATDSSQRTQGSIQFDFVGIDGVVNN
mgnify:CR=1 FL=1